MPHGPFVHDEKEARINWLISTRTERAWLIADFSKFGSHAFTAVGELSDFTGIITDDSLATAEQEALAKRGLTGHIVAV